MSGKRINRRSFLARSAGAAAAAGASLTAASYSRAADANERIGVGLIGCGGRSGAHRNVIRQLARKGENIEIVAVCDVYRPRAEARAQGTSARVYMDHRELLADSAVDIVCIATPDHHHAQQTIDAVEAGKDVYCEKPISHWRQFDITKRMAHAVRKSNRIFQAGTQGLAEPVWERAAGLVRDGAIGNPVHAQCGYFRVGDWGERGMPIPDKDAKPGDDLLWEKFLGDSPKRSFDISRFFRWRMYLDYAGGPSTDLFPHTLSPIVKVLGVGFPSKVVAAGGMFRYKEREVPDTFNMLIDYPEKVTVAVLGTQANDYGIPNVVRGWEATVLFQDPGIVIEPAAESKKKKQEIAVRRATAAEGGRSALEDYWRDFLRCCRTREKPLGGIELAYRVQTTLQMGLLSLLENKVARFDLDREEIVL